MPELDDCLKILAALQVSEIVYHLSGGGDSGATELTSVVFADGREGQLPIVTIGITDHGKTIRLDERLDDLIYALPEGDWINNEGGHGTVTFRPLEPDEDLRVECDMTYGDDNDEPDFDDDDIVTPGKDQPRFDPADAAVAVDDSALQPPKGANP